MKTKVFALCTMFSLSAFFTSCTKEEIVTATDGSEVIELTEKNAPGTQPIAQIAIDAGFSELVSALAYVDAELNAGLVNLFLNGTDQYTVFAPTNQAFLNLYGALGVDSIDDLPADLVLDVLLYHVVEGRRSSNSVVPKRNTRNISTLLGVNFTVNPQAQITAVGNTANIVTANISASNGVIHVIDAVILPIN
jgi:uncharacterized surface protein with fasciclin (FAS1) repeats